jgi:serine protease Do
VAAAIVAIIPTWAVQALTYDQVDAVASQVTVVIAQGLQKGDIEAQMEWNPGSGVLVARSGKTYYALTALHVVRTRQVVYGIRTSDGEVHFIDDEADSTNIIPFGREADDLGTAIEGLDLALVRFQSDRAYPVAVMGNSETLQLGDRVVVSGWPDPGDETARRQRTSTDGQIAWVQPTPIRDGGYSVLYNNLTRRGMSGGPVLNAAGELIGIHGRGRGDEAACQELAEPLVDLVQPPGAGENGGAKVGEGDRRDRAAEAPLSASDPKQLADRASCGMQTLHFLNAAESASLALDYADPPVTESLIAAGLDGKDRADTIEDIYDAFTFDVRSMLRDRPSGGCGSVLLGDRCEEPRR